MSTSDQQLTSSNGLYTVITPPSNDSESVAVMSDGSEDKMIIKITTNPEDADNSNDADDVKIIITGLEEDENDNDNDEEDDDEISDNLRPNGL